MEKSVILIVITVSDKTVSIYSSNSLVVEAEKAQSCFQHSENCLHFQVIFYTSYYHFKDPYLSHHRVVLTHIVSFNMLDLSQKRLIFLISKLVNRKNGSRSTTF